MYFIVDSRSIPRVRLANETTIEPPYVHRRRIPVSYTHLTLPTN